MKPIRLVIDRQTAKWTEMVAEDETTIRLLSAWLPEGAGVNDVVTLSLQMDQQAATDIAMEVTQLRRKLDTAGEKLPPHVRKTK
ncbi:MAG: hypothetical protein E6Z25_02700 [Negativicoccus succinicivorans]|uniref:hypothetical protein n=1 Tax=Negativicoccus succinicivorans TaxID=620903 RepID=UPI000764138D|nr:hypothetical protein [Negativicoccus succinicivorans]MDU5914961.1 hypothetical protein [Negativicoccus succinicivorans]